MSDNRIEKIPTHLKHKPIYGIENYSEIDGQYKNNTDAVGLSLGKAQWSDADFVPAVEVWRRPNGRWSRQSEETTLTRVLDMAMLVIKVLDNHYNGADLGVTVEMRGSVEVKKFDYERKELERELNNYLDVNRSDIQAHIKLLKEAIQAYKD